MIKQQYHRFLRLPLLSNEILRKPNIPITHYKRKTHSASFKKRDVSVLLRLTAVNQDDHH